MVDTLPPEGTPIAQGPAYEAFRQKVFNDLMTAIRVMKHVGAFPYAFIHALSGDFLTRSSPAREHCHTLSPQSAA